jgi:hypothetical protein
VIKAAGGEVAEWMLLLKKGARPGMLRRPPPSAGKRKLSVS